MAEITRLLGITADRLEIGTAPDGSVIVRLMGLEEEAGLTPGLGVMLVLSAAQAREFAKSLLRRADDAEAGSSPHSTTPHH